LVGGRVWRVAWGAVPGLGMGVLFLGGL
jgi:hypothetical protein